MIRNSCETQYLSRLLRIHPVQQYVKAFLVLALSLLVCRVHGHVQTSNDVSDDKHFYNRTNAFGDITPTKRLNDADVLRNLKATTNTFSGASSPTLATKDEPSLLEPATVTTVGRANDGISVVAGNGIPSVDDETRTVTTSHVRSHASTDAMGTLFALDSDFAYSGDDGTAKSSARRSDAIADNTRVDTIRTTPATYVRSRSATLKNTGGKGAPVGYDKAGSSSKDALSTKTERSSTFVENVGSTTSQQQFQRGSSDRALQEQQQDGSAILVDEFACDDSFASLVRLERTLDLQFEDDGTSRSPSDDELVELGNLIVLTFNMMSFQACDFPHFRRMLTATPVLSFEGSVVSFDVVAECRNCTGSLPLFEAVAAGLTAVSTANDIQTATSKSQAGTLLSRQGFDIAARPMQFDDAVEVFMDLCLCPNGPSNDEAETGTPANTTDEVFADTRSFGSPTLDNFLRTLNNNNTGNVLRSVTQLEELQYVECSSNIEKFQSFAYLEVVLFKEKAPSEKEVKALEDSFIETYNRLAFEACDPFFRTITEAKLNLFLDNDEAGDPKSYKGKSYGVRGRQLQVDVTTTETMWGNLTNASVAPTTAPSTIGPTYAPTPVPFRGTALFNVSGTCRNCSVSQQGSFPLFDETFEPLSLLFHSKPSSQLNSTATSPRLGQNGRSLQKITETATCMCWANPTPTDENKTMPLSAPEVFLDIYAEELKALQGDGPVQVVEYPTSLEEGQNVECSPDMQQFQTLVYSDMKINLASLTPEEALKIEQSFKNAYNQLAFQTCDGLFRQVQQVELQRAPINGNGGSGRQLLEFFLPEALVNGSHSNTNTSSSFPNSTNATSPPFATAESDEGYIVPVLFAVTGSCRGCPVTSGGAFNLFDDAFRRRDRRSLSSLSTRQEVPDFASDSMNNNRNVCICPAGEDPTLKDGPAAEDFETDLIDAIVKLQKSGESTSIQVPAENLVEGQVCK